MHFLGLVGEGREGRGRFWNRTEKQMHKRADRMDSSVSVLLGRHGSSHPLTWFLEGPTGSEIPAFSSVPRPLINKLAGLGCRGDTGLREKTQA